MENEKNKIIEVKKIMNKTRRIRDGAREKL